MKKYCLFSLLMFSSWFGFANPPPAEAVFQLTTQQTDPNTFMLTWHIEKGFFLYKKSIRLSEQQYTNVHLGHPSFPPALQKTNAQGEAVSIYREQLALAVPVSGQSAGETLLDVHYQGCSDEGFCYPPQQTQIKLTIDKSLSLSDVMVESPKVSADSVTTNEHKGDSFDQLFSSKSWILIILGFFSAGLLLAFTPCILPMIPVLSGIIIGHGKNLSTRKAFLLSLSYVLSMSVTYSVIGAGIAFMGSNLQVIMQSTWAIGLFSFVFILLALAMFDVYELRLPLALQNKLARLTRNSSGGHYLNAGIMGCLSILILSPCVTAPLIGALTYIAHEGSVTLGMLSLFFLSLGMGTPLLLIGTSAGKLLPKAGHWMNTVKAFFGVMLLAVAIYLLERLLPSPITMGLWGSLLIFSGVYLNALSHAQSKQEKFSQGAGLILLFYGFLILIGASQGHGNPLQPLASITAKTVQESPKNIAKTIPELNAMQALAKLGGKPVILDFYADWCESCKVISSTILTEPRVQKALKDFTLITVDLSANNNATKALLKRFRVVAPPTFIFFDSEGNVLENLRLVGEITGTTLMDHAALALTRKH